MSDKQIFTALEVADHEVRLIVGEFFNTRFNIIKVERIPCNGLSFSKVEDPEAVITAIRTAAANACKMLESKELSVTEIAGMSGFSSISTFNRLFKEHFNVSPTQFRKYLSAGSNELSYSIEQ